MFIILCIYVEFRSVRLWRALHIEADTKWRPFYFLKGIVLILIEICEVCPWGSNCHYLNQWRLSLLTRVCVIRLQRMSGFGIISSTTPLAAPYQSKLHWSSLKAIYRKCHNKNKISPFQQWILTWRWGIYFTQSRIFSHIFYKLQYQLCKTVETSLVKLLWLIRIC